MSLDQARNILIKKLKARVLEIYRQTPNIANEQSLESESWYALIAHYEKLERKVALEQTPVWLSSISKENFSDASKIWVTPKAYKHIIEDPNNTNIKSTIERAICFSLYNGFTKDQPENYAFSDPNSVSTGFSAFPIKVEVIWEKGNPENRTIFIRAYPIEPCVISTQPEKLNSTLRRCLPLSAI